MKLRFFWLLGCAVLFGGCAGLYLFRHHWIPPAVNYFGQSHQLKLNQFSGFSVARREIRLAHARVDLAGQPQEIKDLHITTSSWFGFPWNIRLAQADLSRPAEMQDNPPSDKVFSLVQQLAFWREVGDFSFELARARLDEMTFSLSATHAADADRLSVRHQDYLLELVVEPEKDRVSADLALYHSQNLLLTLGLKAHQQDQELELLAMPQVSTATLLPQLARFELPHVSALTRMEGELAARVNIGIDTQSMIPTRVQGELLALDGFELDVAWAQWPALNLLLDASPLTFSYTRDSFNLNLKQLKVNDGKTGSAVELGAVACTSVTECRADIGVHASLDKTWVNLPDVQLDGLALYYRGELRLRETGVQLVQSQPGWLRLSALNAKNITLPEIQLDFWGSDIALDKALQPQLSLNKLSTRINAQIAPEGGFNGELELNQIRWADDDLKADFNLNRATVSKGKLWLPTLTLSGQLGMSDKEQLSISAELATDTGKTLADIHLGHRIQNQLGSLRMTLVETRFEGKEQGLASYFSDWPYDADIQKGDVSLSGELHWQLGERLDYSGSLVFAANELSGVYQETGIFDLGVSSAFLLSPEGVVSQDDFRLSVDKLDAGIVVKDVFVQAGLGIGSAEVKLAEAKVFSGRVRARPFTYDFGQASQLEVEIGGLQLKDMLTLAAYDAVDGDASLTGVLPLTISSQGIVMKDGNIAADGAGYIKYTPPGGAESDNVALQLVNQALSNYQFDTLSSEVEYQESGELKLNMKLSGANPDMNEGQKINLNVNLTDDIPALLKSLQLSRTITDMLEREINKKSQH